MKAEKKINHVQYRLITATDRHRRFANAHGRVKGPLLLQEGTFIFTSRITHSNFSFRPPLYEAFPLIDESIASISRSPAGRQARDRPSRRGERSPSTEREKIKRGYGARYHPTGRKGTREEEAAVATRDDRNESQALVSFPSHSLNLCVLFLCCVVLSLFLSLSLSLALPNQF